MRIFPKSLRLCVSSIANQFQNSDSGLLGLCLGRDYAKGAALSKSSQIQTPNYRDKYKYPTTACSTDDRLLVDIPVSAVPLLVPVGAQGPAPVVAAAFTFISRILAAAAFLIRIVPLHGNLFPAFIKAVH